ncbi:MAG: hypothetical protein M1837_003542 [Sclerophora amabilis]|nr:MAG: hypothetical protein M1837_003542 [Sclerophora amabilis]
MASSSASSVADGEQNLAMMKPALSSDPSHKSIHSTASRTEANIRPKNSELGADADSEKGSGGEDHISSALDPSSYPDGGFEAWSVVAGGFCCLFCSFGWINCIGVFQGYYQIHQLQAYTPSAIAWIPALETFMMFAGGPIFGKLYDNFGPRYILLFGSFMHVFGLMMTSISTQYYQFLLAQGICSPIGASAIFYPALSTVGTWFFKNRALAFGVIASGSSLGGVIFPIMVERLVEEVGFGWAMRIAAFLILFMMVIANLTVRSRIPPSPKPLNIMEFITPLKEPPFLLTCLGSFLFFFGLFLPFNYIILQATSDGMSPGLASYLLSMLNAASLFGRIIPGYIADRIGRYNVMIVMTYFSAITVLAIWLPARSNAPTIIFAILYGFGSGAFVSMAPALIAQISDIRQIGVRNGTLFAIISTAALCGNPIGGALVTKYNGGFTGLQIFAGVMMMAGSTLFVAARVTLGGFKAVQV